MAKRTAKPATAEERAKAYEAEMLSVKIPCVSLRDGFNTVNKKFKSEKEFDDNLEPKIPFLIKEMYGLTVCNIERQKVFDLNHIDYYKIRTDFFVETEEGKSFIIESKNPIQEKHETFAAISQIMSYDFLIKKVGIDCEVILAISAFAFKYVEFMVYFRLKYDLIVNNEDKIAFWVNEFK